MKQKRRAHDLAMSLPSRMLKSFNAARVMLLGDKSFYPGKSPHDDADVSLNNSTTMTANSNQPAATTSSAYNRNRSRRMLNICESLSNSFHRWVRRLSTRMHRMMDMIPVIQPSSSAKLMWDFLNMLVIIVSLFGLPLTVIFDFSY